MATVPTPRTWALNEAPTSPNMNSGITDPLTFLLNKPIAQVRQTVAQSLANNVWVAITCTTEDVDTNPSGVGGHDNATNPSRYTAVYPGRYRLGGAAGYAANATGLRGARWAVNGNAIDPGGSVVPAGATSFTVVPAPGEFTFLNVGDYVELQGLQSSGGALNTAVSSTVQSTMTVEWISIS